MLILEHSFQTIAFLFAVVCSHLIDMMKLASLFCLLVRALPAISSAPQPVVIYDMNHIAALHPRQLDLEVYNALEERLPTIHIGTYSVAKTFPANYVLLQV